MIFEQFYLECLSLASYLVGDETTGRAVVIDPQRDVSGYLREAEARGLRIEWVVETHVHADFLSGHLELAARTGATIGYGEAVDVDFPIYRLRDGERIELGDVVLEVRATPGHTPESISIVVFERRDADVPYGVLTGDALFIGDVGRPDLLATSGTGHTPERMARELYRSLHERLLTLPDATHVYPAHGAGSACGKQMSSARTSTIGEQRAANYALAPMSEDRFVSVVLEGQSPPPGYFAYDAQRNRADRALLDESEPVTPLPLDAVLSYQREGVALLDSREPMDFAAGHLRGAVDVGLQGRFAEYAGDVLAPGQPVALVGDPATAAEAKVRLARIGFDDVVGYLDDPGAAFATRPDLLERSSRLTVAELDERRSHLRDLVVLDVRSPTELTQGSVPGARNVPLTRLTGEVATLDRDAPTVVYCASGYRSMTAASALTAMGFRDVSDLLGGYDAWRAAATKAERGRDAGSFVRMAETDAIPEVDVDEARRRVDDGAFLLDVHEPDEWQAGHAPDASFLPMGQVTAERERLPHDRPILAICRSGGRSGRVTAALVSWGYDAANVAGGMQAWAAAGHDVVTDDGGPGTVA